jgi:hypothetical protein
MYMSSFNWKNFYTRKNAKIIEKILIAEKINLSALMELTASYAKFINKSYKDEEVLNLFYKVIHDKEANHGDYSWLVSDINYKGGAVTKKIQLFSAQALNKLIMGGFLPKELNRLPRESNSNIGFKIIDSYYPDCQSILDSKELIKHPLNYSKKPAVFNYDTVQKRWLQLGFPDNQIELCCMDNRLGAYIEVSEIQIFSDFDNDFYFISCLQRNCGNPFYVRRYEGLERLKVIGDFGFDLQKIFNQGAIEIKSHLLSELQLTDMESKCHLRRTIAEYIYPSPFKGLEIN